MSNTKQQTNTNDIISKISNLGELKGQTQSSMITLIIPPKYCI